jgi:hypothetical protein
VQTALCLCLPAVGAGGGVGHTVRMGVDHAHLRGAGVEGDEGGEGERESERATEREAR